jgi:hypothetical protein
MGGEMELFEIADLYERLIKRAGSVASRQASISLRKTALGNLSSNSLVKVAFDTRRVNQETDYIPRRGLQNYHRSDQFISEAYAQKIANFTKLKNILDEIKNKYGKHPEWQDSYCRVLLNTLNQSLRTIQQDGDFGDTQPSIGSFDYVEELLFTRYRLEMNNIAKYGEEQLKDILLSKDEPLIRKGQVSTYEITKRDIMSHGYDTLIEKLFNVQATSEHPNVKRIVTIQIEDRFIEDKRE